VHAVGDGAAGRQRPAGVQEGDDTVLVIGLGLDRPRPRAVRDGRRRARWWAWTSRKSGRRCCAASALEAFTEQGRRCGRGLTSAICRASRLRPSRPPGSRAMITTWRCSGRRADGRVVWQGWYPGRVAFEFNTSRTARQVHDGLPLLDGRNFQPRTLLQMIADGSFEAGESLITHRFPVGAVPGRVRPRGLPPDGVSRRGAGVVAMRAVVVERCGEAVWREVPEPQRAGASRGAGAHDRVQHLQRDGSAHPRLRADGRDRGRLPVPAGPRGRGRGHCAVGRNCRYLREGDRVLRPMLVAARLRLVLGRDGGVGLREPTASPMLRTARLRGRACTWATRWFRPGFRPRMRSTLITLKEVLSYLRSIGVRDGRPPAGDGPRAGGPRQRSTSRATRSAPARIVVAGRQARGGGAVEDLRRRRLRGHPPGRLAAGTAVDALGRAGGRGV
jgi:hypothetical protein